MAKPNEIKVAREYSEGEPVVEFFDDAGEACGQLWAKGNILSFEGNAEASARIFFDALTTMTKVSTKYNFTVH